MHKLQTAQGIEQTWPTAGRMILRLIRDLLQPEGVHTNECQILSHL